MRNIAFTLFILTLPFQSCVDQAIAAEICYEGTVIGKIRSSGGGIAISMTGSVLSSHQWRGYENVIEALNVPQHLYEPGERIYFTARSATEEEQVFVITADGDESDKPIVYVLKCGCLE